MAIKHIIFDWDGTLARTLDLWLEGYTYSLEQRHLTFEPQEIIKEFFHNHHEVPARHPTIDFPAVANETRDFVHKSLNTVKLYDGALELLNHLKDNKLPISLVSSSSRALLKIGLGTHQLEPYFKSIVAGDDGYGHKPETLPFEETLKRMQATAKETLIIGDSHVDIEAGKAVGCKTCLFAPLQNRQFHDYELLKSMNADYEIQQISELLECL